MTYYRVTDSKSRQVWKGRPTLVAETILEGVPAEEAHRKLFDNRSRGFIMVIIGATLWGLSGTAAQQLFQHDGFSPAWLVTVRMTLSGLILIVAVSMSSGIKSTCSIWTSRADALRLVVFSLLGLLAVQYTYFAAIRFGNAATATFLQYVGPAFITGWLALRLRRWPSAKESAALTFAVLGTFLLVTNGSVKQVIVPGSAIFWGLLSALALAFYTLSPVQLMKSYGSATITGWAMLIGGVILAPFSQPWRLTGVHWTLDGLLLVVFVVLFGTLIAFYLYLGSLKFITPSETSLLACVEPLSAASASVLWLHVHLGTATVLGGLSILITVVLLSLPSSQKARHGS